MKISKLFTNLFTKTGKDDKIETTTDSHSEFLKRIRKRHDEEQKRLDKWRKELRKSKMTSNNNTTISNYPGSIFTNSTYTNITSTTKIADNAITINGDPINGSVSIDVPLKVNGRDIVKEIDEMRDALLLLKRDVDMEAKYPRLKELKDEYERALEKYKTFEAIKESK